MDPDENDRRHRDGGEADQKQALDRVDERPAGQGRLTSITAFK
jgi:hypothetical protein